MKSKVKRKKVYFITVVMAYKLYDSCNGEKQLYIVHGADHSENYRKDPGGYEKIVTKFIEERIERSPVWLALC